MRITFALPALITVTALSLAGCTNNAADEAAVSGATDNTDLLAAVQVDEAAAALLPADLASAGTLLVGTDAMYPPNEYKDPNGEPTGWAVTLVDATAKRLGLEVDWEIIGFDSILPNVQGGKYNMGSSSFTDNVERQASVDFIDFYEAGIQWAALADATIDPEDACGLTVAVQTGTIEDTDELPARSQKCEEAGKEPITIQKYTDQADATNAVLMGKADAMSADSPITGSAVAASDGKLAAVGAAFDTAPYGFIVGKDSGLQEPIQKAVQSLMDDGTYLKILTDAGVEAGAIEKATINGATE
ncbi:MAG: ABC transporter substrate-binding protein [Corynebacterium sp.]|nr:ABC transporter substrate-binding protein [Corynebacterium sp.]